MKKRKLTAKSSFQVGDLYLFHTSNPNCPSQESLWGFYDKQINGVIYLEHSSRDLCHFRQWHSLPKAYRYYRLATRSELRDYMFNLGFSDIKTRFLADYQKETLWNIVKKLYL